MAWLVQDTADQPQLVDDSFSLAAETLWMLLVL